MTAPDEVVLLLDVFMMVDAALAAGAPPANRERKQHDRPGKG